MKSYKAPILVACGNVTELTQGMLEGATDPDGITRFKATGSIGFNL